MPDRRIQAQELAFQALESEKPSESAILAREALALDAECVDAQTLLVRLEQPSPRLQARQLRLISSRAEAKLGTLYLQQHRGHLWERAEARPFLRAKRALAEALEKAGKAMEAILHLEAMLILDPDDPLDARTALIRCYLASGQLKPLEELLKREPESAFIAWTIVLARIKARNEKAARKALDHARQQNPLVEAFLTGRQKQPRRLKDHIEAGSPEEAVQVLKRFGEVWNNDREALYWLFRQE